MRKLSPLLLAIVLLVAPAFGLARVNLLTAATDNGSDVETYWPLDADSGCGWVRVTGTFDGATVTLQHSIDNGSTWSSLLDDNAAAVTWTTSNAGAERLLNISRRKLRLNVTDAGASTEVSGWLDGGRDGRCG